MASMIRLPEDFDRMAVDYDRFRDYLVAAHQA
jgi:hypothetical protein